MRSEAEIRDAMAEVEYGRGSAALAGNHRLGVTLEALIEGFKWVLCEECALEKTMRNIKSKRRAQRQ